MAEIDIKKAQAMLNKIMELEKKFERDDTISDNQVEKEIRKIVEGVLNAIEIDQVN